MGGVTIRIPSAPGASSFARMREFEDLNLSSPADGGIVGGSHDETELLQLKFMGRAFMVTTLGIEESDVIFDLN